MQLTRSVSDESGRKDKLAEQKRAEREKHDAHKEELRRKKAEKQEETSKLKAVFRQLRTFGSSKRGEREARQAAKCEKHAETGSECEHGIWRCKICNPPLKTRR
ncbi:g9800 [Coccomyxa viridis]|uniref:G9800 protein n=1 Tax=Coccomyxa viridis TaxID=1274662 RepID=A0ABP1G8E7_9CHLO